MATKTRQNRDSVLALALARGLSQTAAGTEAGVSASTVRRRLDDKAFCDRVEALRAAIVGEASGKLTAAAAAAVGALTSLLETSVPPAVRLGAARAILEAALRFREAVAFESRLRAVESRQTGGPGDAEAELIRVRAELNRLQIRIAMGDDRIVDELHNQLVADRAQVIERDDWYGSQPPAAPVDDFQIVRDRINPETNGESRNGELHDDA